MVVRRAAKWVVWMELMMVVQKAARSAVSKVVSTAEWMELDLVGKRVLWTVVLMAAEGCIEGCSEGTTDG